MLIITLKFRVSCATDVTRRGGYRGLPHPYLFSWSAAHLQLPDAQPSHHHFKHPPEQTHYEPNDHGTLVRLYHLAACGFSLRTPVNSGKNGLLWVHYHLHFSYDSERFNPFFSLISDENQSALLNPHSSKASFRSDKPDQLMPQKIVADSRPP